MIAARIIACAAAAGAIAPPQVTSARTVAQHLWTTRQLFDTDIHAIVQCGSGPSEYRLAYMPCRNRGEIIRLMLEEARCSYEDRASSSINLMISPRLRHGMYASRYSLGPEPHCTMAWMSVSKSCLVVHKCCATVRALVTWGGAIAEAAAAQEMSAASIDEKSISQQCKPRVQVSQRSIEG